MNSIITRNKAVLAIALLLAFAVSVWLLATPGTTPQLSTYAVFAALLLAATAVAVNTWRNSQATSSVGQLLHETETAPTTASSSTPIRPDVASSVR